MSKGLYVNYIFVTYSIFKEFLLTHLGQFPIQERRITLFPTELGPIQLDTL